MTRMKKIILSFMMMLLVSASAFAASGFEANLTVPLGAGIGIHTFESIEKLTDEQKKSIKGDSYAGFDFGVLAQVGYMLQVADGMGVSILGELGYSRDNFAVQKKANGYETKINTSFDSFQVGLLPKFNIGAFSIGLGGGVKIPLAGTMYQEMKSDGGTIKEEIKLKDKDIKEIYTPTVIPYVKLTADYSIFFTEQFALNLGIYAGYDFGMNSKSSVEGPEKSFKYNNVSSFDIGAQIGLKFGPKA